jgi:hypothetical protein
MGCARLVAVLLAMCNAGKTEHLKEWDQFEDIGVNERENTKLESEQTWRVDMDLIQIH